MSASLDCAPSLIYTIGHGDRTSEEFIKLLQQHQIQCVVDVRSRPHPNYPSPFSQPRLFKLLNKTGVAYVYLAHWLGDKPNDQNCYAGDGRLDYCMCWHSPFFQLGIRRVQALMRKQQSVVLLGSELQPELCHRAQLIGKALTARGIDVIHIDEAGQLCTQARALKRYARSQQPSFFKLPHDELLVDTVAHRRVEKERRRAARALNKQRGRIRPRQRPRVGV